MSFRSLGTEVDGFQQFLGGSKTVYWLEMWAQRCMDSSTVEGAQQLF
jgi:hypothetical protein